jgi:hypothetical protein
MRLAIRLIEHKSGQTNFDSESFSPHGPELGELTEQVPVEDTTNLVLNQGKP